MRWAIIAAAFGLAILTLGVANAQEEEPPTGEYTLTPSQGTIGTTVSVEGTFDQDITHVRFQCNYRRDPYEAVETIHSPDPPSPTIAFEYTIPETLSIRQGGGNVIEVLGGDCAFYAESTHRLLAFRMPFAVTSDALPDAGAGPQAGPGAGLELGLAGAAAAIGGALIVLGWRRRPAGRS